MTFPTSDTQIYNCAMKNEQELSSIESALEESIFPLNVEYNEKMWEINNLVKALRHETRKLKYDAEIRKLTEERAALDK